MADTKYVRGADKLQQRIATIRANIDLPDLTKQIGALLLRRNLERFDAQVDPDGSPWAPLADSTLRRKKGAGYGDRPALVREGDLRDAIRVIAGGAGSTFINTGAGLRIGVEDPEIAVYAKALNKGVPGRIPARKFLGISAGDVKAVDALMRRKAKQLTDLE